MHTFLENIKFALFTTLLFVISDQLFKSTVDSLGTLLDHFRGNEIIFLFIVSIIVSFIKSRRIAYSILSLLVVFQYFQMVHFLFYRTWIEPLEIYLFFAHLHETYATLVGRLDIFVLPSIIFIFTYLFLYIIMKFQYPKTLKKKYFSHLIIILFLIGPIQTFALTSARDFKINADDFIITSTIKTFNNFFGIIVPNKFFGVVDPEFDQKLKVATKIENYTDEDMNIILILGESLRYKNMSLFDYERETTPYLDSLKDNENFIYKKTISAAVFTYVSLSSIIHCIDRPNGMPAVVAKNTCLFKFAKERGYETAFISAQARDSMNNIRNSLCQEYLDIYKDAYTKNKDYYLDEDDSYLLDELKNFDLNANNNFLVLHQMGSHSLYKNRYPKNFKHYEEGNTINEYDNSVLYTDDLLKRITEHVQNTTSKPTLIIFTSDHGESLGENGVFAHGNIKIPDQYHVPFYIHAINTKIPQSEKFLDIDFLTHYQMSKYLSMLFGYSIDQEEIFSDKEVVVTGKDITGIDGYVVIKKSALHVSK